MGKLQDVPNQDLKAGPPQADTAALGDGTRLLQT